MEEKDWSLHEKYSEIEFKKWEEFQKICLARQHDQWINNTCRIVDSPCRIYRCFVRQIVILVKGFF
jgi:hypothetical protein